MGFIGFSGESLASDMIRQWIRNGQVYSANSSLTVGGAGQGYYALSIFNPATSGKDILVISTRAMENFGQTVINSFSSNADPAYDTAITPVNLYLGGTASQLAGHVTANQNGSISFPSNLIEQMSQADAELLRNGAAYLLPKGTAKGIIVATYVQNSQNVGLSLKWAEL
jgi:hypothetical protein